MSYIGYVSNQDQMMAQSAARHELPILNWPADLFKCDAADSEIEVEDVRPWHIPSISVLDQKIQANGEV